MTDIMCCLILEGRSFVLKSIRLPEYLEGSYKPAMDENGMETGEDAGSLEINGGLDEVVAFAATIDTTSVGLENLMIFADIEYDDECIFELSPEQLSMLAALKVPFGITCYQTNRY